MNEPSNKKSGTAVTAEIVPLNALILIAPRGVKTVEFKNDSGKAANDSSGIIFNPRVPPMIGITV